MKTQKNETNVQFKIGAEQKEQLRKMAEDANLSMTDYIKQSVFSEKNIILDKGGSIAAALTEIQILLDRALRGKDITTELEIKLLNTLEEVRCKFSVITEQLTDFHLDEESEVM